MEDAVIKMLIEKNTSLAQMIETQKEFINRLTDTCQKQQSMNDKLHDQLSKIMAMITVQVSPSDSKSSIKGKPDESKPDNTKPDNTTPDLKQMCKDIECIRLAGCEGNLLVIITLGKGNDNWIKRFNLKETDSEGGWSTKDYNTYFTTKRGKLAFMIPATVFDEIMPYIDVEKQCTIGSTLIKQYIKHHIEKITHDGNEFNIKLKTQLHNSVLLSLQVIYDIYVQGADGLILNCPSTKFLKWGSDLINVQYN